MSEAKRLAFPRISPGGRSIVFGGIAVLVLAQIFLLWLWSREPPLHLSGAIDEDAPGVTGHATVDALVGTIDWLLDKPGGYLSNDVYPPSLWLDNMPSFEFGVITQCRDLARILRNDYSRSQSQSTEHPALATAEPALNHTNDQWLYPSTQTKLREARRALTDYRAELADPSAADAQFFARADNLGEWLAVVERRLGNMSQRLSASIGQVRVNTNLAGERGAAASTPMPASLEVRTPWLELDNVFFEARGTAWAMLQFMTAARQDFAGVLADKNAAVSLEQVIRELESGLAPLRSPAILNGRGYGLFANHSLVLASYISRAHSAVIDLRVLLADG